MCNGWARVQSAWYAGRWTGDCGPDVRDAWSLASDEIDGLAGERGGKSVEEWLTNVCAVLLVDGRHQRRNRWLSKGLNAMRRCCAEVAKHA